MPLFLGTRARAYQKCTGENRPFHRVPLLKLAPAILQLDPNSPEFGT
jgi:hypothetical protein